MTNPVKAILGRVRGVTATSPDCRQTGSACLSASPKVYPQVPVLLASARESDRLIMHDLLIGTRYILGHSQSLAQAANLGCHIVLPIILYDQFFDIVDWQLALRRLTCSWPRPSVLLLSDCGDEELLEGALRHGSLDVLVRPLHAREVLCALDLAYCSWEHSMAGYPQEYNRTTIAKKKSALQPISGEKPPRSPQQANRRRNKVRAE
jgi:DNA-binding NarL/FixJ family response regulator